MKRQFLRTFLGLASTLLLTATAAAQSSSDYSIPWFTFGGGGNQSSAGAYTAVGSLAHFESIAVTAGPYTLASGFWAGTEDDVSELKLSITHARGRLVISWEGCGILEEADTVVGLWTTVAGATSPYGVTVTLDKKFYRLRSCEKE